MSSARIIGFEPAKLAQPNPEIYRLGTIRVNECAEACGGLKIAMPKIGAASCIYSHRADRHDFGSIYVGVGRSRLKKGGIRIREVPPMITCWPEVGGGPMRRGTGQPLRDRRECHELSKLPRSHARSLDVGAANGHRRDCWHPTEWPFGRYDSGLEQPRALSDCGGSVARRTHPRRAKTTSRPRRLFPPTQEGLGR